MTAETIAIGRSARWKRCASSAATSEIAKPIETAIAVSLMCSRSAGWSTGSQFSRTQSVQKSRFS